MGVSFRLFTILLAFGLGLGAILLIVGLVFIYLQKKVKDWGL